MKTDERVNWVKAVGWLLGLVGMVALWFYWTRPEHVLTRGIVAASKRAPEYDARWAGCIREVAGRYVRSTIQRQVDVGMTKLAEQALDEGCRDPLLRYLRLRRRFQFLNISNEPLAREGLEIVRTMEACDYPVQLRAFAASRALDVWDMAFTWRKLEPEVRNELLQLTWRHTMESIRDPIASETLVRSLCELLDDYYRSVNGSREDAWRRIDAALEARFGDCATIHFLRGRRAIKIGWEARGHGYAYTVTKEGWAKLGAELETARRELELAWKLDPGHPKTAAAMITVCMGEGSSREEMEEWFRRGLATGRDGSELCSAKGYWLAPRWHGSAEEQRAFARECLEHPEWGHDVVLRLWRMHLDRREIAELPLTYFGQPDVWADIRVSLERFLADNPDAAHYHMHLAYHAWLAKDREVLRRELPLLDPAWCNFEWIGGRAVYEQMVAAAATL